jgi:hypothetical protein
MTRLPLIAFLVWLAASSHMLRAGEFSLEDVEFFEKYVRPILAENCYECHSGLADQPDSGLRLDSRDGVLRGGENGPVMVPGDVESSRLLLAVSYDDVDLQMPPDGKLPDDAIANLREWVRRGGPWPNEEPAESKATPKSEFDLQDRKKSHWAWQPVQDVTPPEVNDKSWPLDDMDRFILAKLDEAGIAPAGPTDRRTWLRRVTLDLTGLPPTVDEIKAFLADESDQAYQSVVDRLLASPHFGERWARHWLDLIRYAETKGHEFDYPAPNAWEYRDYVIRALNADVPYDQFVLEHLAGDLLPSPRLHPQAGFNESIIGTGFWFLGEEVHSPVDSRQDQADRFDNRIDVMCKTFLGLTVACARCHDHKFDAISSRDYYSLFGILESSSLRLARFDSLEGDRQVAQELADLDQSTQQTLRTAVANDLRPTVERMDEYIVAAADISDDGANVALIAAERNLNAGKLEAWASHLQEAALTSTDPCFLLARLIKERDVAPPETELNQAHRDADANTLQDVIVDYAHLKEGQWLPDDFSYGPGPRLPGMIFVSGTCESPKLFFIERAAAEFDSAWDVRTLAKGHQLEPGAMGSSVVRPGRTLNTPNFTVRDKVHFLVRGKGQVYASIDQHTLINGPLHGKLVKSFDTNDKWQWVSRDFSDYTGRTAHLEFTPDKAGTLSISVVVQAAKPPTDPTCKTDFGMDISTATTKTPIEIAKALRERFLAALARLDYQDTIGSEHAPGDAQILNWMLNHPALFDQNAAGGQSLVASTKYLASRRTVFSRIQTESRLCLAMQDLTGVEGHVFVRGSWKNRGSVVPRRGLEALTGEAPLDTGPGSGRLQLATQLVDPHVNPFVSRVMVNRVWHHLFGRGIVASVDNFGALGESPTHPDLLDFLSTNFVRDGWSVKHLIRRIVLSNTYRMSSDSPVAVNDPQNLLLHRMRVRRLEGEVIRDAMLVISGSLDRTQFGRPVPVYLDEFMEGRGRPEKSGPLDGANRRSIYVEVRRNFLPPMMLAFDTPIPFSTVGRRNVSNVPAQSLVMLNDPLVHELSRRWVKRVCAELPEPGARIQQMYEESFGRPPTETELARCEEFASHGDGPDPWIALGHSLWNVKEFIFAY